mmetsp:Transcript_14521/g.36482  ORF Transcript_14521/g.36482 Transcript_14521/m.36482 type:complete len:306 (+) Transcript_14521:466-1383(+)
MCHLSAIDGGPVRCGILGRNVFCLLGVSLRETFKFYHDLVLSDCLESGTPVAGPHSLSVQRHDDWSLFGVPGLPLDGKQRDNQSNSGKPDPQTAAGLPSVSFDRSGTLCNPPEFQAFVSAPGTPLFLLFIGKVLSDECYSGRKISKGVSSPKILAAGGGDRNVFGIALGTLCQGQQRAHWTDPANFAAPVSVWSGSCSRLLGGKCLGNLQPFGSNLSRRDHQNSSQGAPGFGSILPRPPPGALTVGVRHFVVCLDCSRPPGGLAASDEPKIGRIGRVRKFLCLYAGLSRSRKGHSDGADTLRAGG